MVSARVSAMFILLEVGLTILAVGFASAAVIYEYSRGPRREPEPSRADLAGPLATLAAAPQQPPGQPKVAVDTRPAPDAPRRSRLSAAVLVLIAISSTQFLVYLLAS